MQGLLINNNIYSSGNYAEWIKYNYDNIIALTQEQFKKLIQSNCDYCKRQPSNKKKLKRKTLDYIVYNGVDRVDSSRGYTLDNCVPCCYKCNIAKSDMTRAEFFEWILEVAKQIAGNKASENSSSGWGE